MIRDKTGVSTEKCAIALSEEELNSGLPRVCICCGEPATVNKPKGFWRQPPIQFVPSIGIIGVIRMLVQISDAASKGQHLLHTPFCDRHASYWSWHKYITLARLGMAALFFFGLIAAAVLALSIGQVLAMAWAFLCVLALFAWAGLTIYVQTGRIAQLEPNPDFLFLCNVSKGFRNALGRGSVGPYPDDRLASMQRSQQFWQIANISVIPLFAAFALCFVGGALFLIAPPSGLPQPGGGPATRGNDLHCYEQLTQKHVTHEARSYLRWHSGDTVEGWDRKTTVEAVDRLYAMGAQKVYYHPVLLMVVLPKDAEARRRILDWQFATVRKNQGERIPDEQQSYLMVTPN